jgi:hypothetical protein
VPAWPGGAAGQQPGAATQSGGELLGTEGRAPGRRQFDGQRHAIEAGAQLGDRRRVVRGHLEGGIGRAGPRGEQEAGLGGGDRASRAIFWQAQRRYGNDELARDVEAFPACCEDPYPPAPFEQRGHQAGGRLQDVLAVVEHDQHLAVGEHPDKGRGRARGLSFRNLKDLSDAGRDERGIGEGRQLDQPGTIVEVGLGQRRHTQGEAGLTAPAGAGQRDDPGGLKALEHSGDLRAASHQRTHLCGQPRGPLLFACRLHTPIQTVHGPHHIFL